MRKTVFTRILSTVLTLVMLTALIPFNAAASDSGTEHSHDDIHYESTAGAIDYDIDPSASQDNSSYGSTPADGGYMTAGRLLQAGISYQSNSSTPLTTSNGTQTYTLFNSGRGTSSTSTNTSNYNTGYKTLNNSGYDLYASAGSATVSTIFLGLPFTVSGEVTETATLTVKAFDVDESSGERDLIYLVDDTAGTVAKLDGYLHGMNQQWNTSTLEINKSLFTVGHTYHFMLQESVSGWVVYVREVSLGLTIGAYVDPDIVSNSFSGSINASGVVSTSLSVTSSANITYNLEYSATLGFDQHASATGTINATSTGATVNKSFTLESGSPAGAYTVFVTLRNAATGVVKATYQFTAGYKSRGVTYNSNGGSNTLPRDTTTYYEGNTVTVKFDNLPTKTDHKFLGWATSSSAAAPAYTASGTKTFVIGSSDVVLYAVWEKLDPHNYVTHPAKAPTCTEYGWGEYVTCAHCGYTTYSSISPLGHDYKLTATVEPTCTADGYMEFACVRSGCGAVKRQTLAATGHQFGGDNICDKCGYTVDIHTHSYTVNIIAPTCTEMGYTRHTCSCGHSYRDAYIEQTGHKWNNGVITTAKTCTSDGLMTYTCTVCAVTHTEKIPAGHNWEETVVTAATCTADGKKTRVCRDCAASETEIIPAGHKWNEGTVTVAPACKTKGEKTCTCSVCNATQKFELRELGHNYVNGVCTRCGIKFIDDITNLPEHPVYGMYFEVDEIVSNYGPDIIDEYGVLLDFNPGAKLEKVAVYLTQDGTMWRRCIACTGTNIQYATYVPYLSYGTDIKYTGLNSDWINIFRLKQGDDGIWRYNDYVTIGVNLEDKNGRLLLSLYDIGQAGALTRVFDDLDEMKAWLADGGCSHNWSGWITDTPATCTAPGSRHIECTLCNKVKTTSYIPALGHSYSGTVTREATCTTPGVITHTCSRCADSYVTYVYSEHHYTLTSHVAPTCTVDGSNVYTCDICHDTYTEVIPGGHDYTATVTKRATKTESGIITYTCSRCGHSYTEDIAPRPEANILLIQDRLPWTESTNTVLLNRLLNAGFITGWDVTTTSGFASAELTDYSVIFIANDQTTATYNQLSAFNEAITNFAKAGGTVVYGACDHGWAAGSISYTLPGGVSKSNYYSYHNYIINPDHPVVTGCLTDGKALTDEVLYSTYSSHTYFNQSTLPEGAVSILSDANGKATLVEYPLGNGHIIAGGLTWEYTYVRSFVNGTSFAKNVYDDLLVYALSLADPCEHTYSTVSVIPSTCTAKGYTLHVCTKCGATLKDTFIDATGHTPGAWTVARAATEAAEGLKEKRCTVCNGVLETEVLPMINAARTVVDSVTDSVIVGQTAEFTVTIYGSAPAKSLAIVPRFDTGVFEMVSAEWTVSAVIQSIEKGSYRSVCAWDASTDINKTVYKFTLKAIALTDMTSVDCLVMVHNDNNTIVNSVIAKNISVIKCPHASCTRTDFDGSSHAVVCDLCGYADVESHKYDSVCDPTCNECTHVRTAPHSYGTEWSKDNTSHWHQCGLCGLKKDTAAHAYDSVCDGTCNTCGYTRTAPHSYSTEWSTDESSHWHQCSLCQTRKDTAAHAYDSVCDDTCNVCAHKRTAPHDYKAEWSISDASHWHECKLCGNKKDEHTHNYDNDNDMYCNDCNYRRYRRGDFDRDDDIDSDDAIYLLYSVFFAQTYPIYQNGDVNGDGKVNSDDAIHLLYYIFFPSMYPLSN